jgi:hypothetical protein
MNAIYNTFTIITELMRYSVWRVDMEAADCEDEW